MASKSTVSKGSFFGFSKGASGRFRFLNILVWCWNLYPRNTLGKMYPLFENACRNADCEP